MPEEEKAIKDNKKDLKKNQSEQNETEIQK